MKRITLSAAVLGLLFAWSGPELSATTLLPKHPGSHWESLKHGNKEFVKNHSYAKQRKKQARGQNPHCAILSCSDSRVPPEIVFSQDRLGELFVARVAGNVADDVVIDSLEFAVGNYDVNTLVVLGHSHCGAVEGALKHLQRNGGKVDPEGPGHLNAVLIPIETAIVAAGIDIYAKDALEKSVRANIIYVVNQLLLNSSVITEALAKGQIDIIGAEYSLKSGKVRKIVKFTKDHLPKMIKIN